VSGARSLEVTTFPCPDALQLGVRVMAEMTATGVEDHHVGIDSVGVGAAPVGLLRATGQIRIHALNGGERAYPTGDEKFANLRAQMWWQMRLDLQRGDIALPDDEELFQDLTAPEWETRNGVIYVESKEALRARLKRSPDKGDAAVYWNWVRPRERPVSSGLPSANTEKENVHPGFNLTTRERNTPVSNWLEQWERRLSSAESGYSMPHESDYQEPNTYP
jgi:hypothetical protein